MNKDRITGIVGLVFCALLGWQVTTIKQVPNAVEPGPRLMPILALSIIALCSVALLITSFQKTENPPEKYFPQGGVKKITVGFALLVAYGIALSIFGFLLTTPFAMMAFIYLLKDENKVKLHTTIIISISVTVFIYLMFVVGFSINLPTGILF